jgi:deoxycytidine triphosphate deaminase
MSQSTDGKSDAIEKFEKYRSSDPFPDIKPALLNSADIIDYVNITGMIEPFHPEDLKPASYALRLLGEYVYWDDKGVKQTGYINKGEQFILKSDSIAFVSLEPLFQLPDYIAARFNLKINMVYRGLLLGTGPLVDPGFIGFLSFPLHNLTTNDYTFIGGERIVWMEFTKLSDNNEWLYSQQDKDIVRQGPYIRNRKFKHDSLPTVQDFVRDAEEHRPVRSSIPSSVYKSEIAAEKARESAETMRRRFTIGLVISIITLLITVAVILLNVYSMHQQAINFVNNAEQRQQELQSKLIGDTQNLISLERKVDSLNQKIIELQSGKSIKNQKSETPSN